MRCVPINRSSRLSESLLHGGNCTTCTFTSLLYMFLLMIASRSLTNFLALGLGCVPLPDVLSHLSDEINMQEGLSHQMCPHKP